MANRKRVIDADWHQLYVVEGKTQKELCEMFDTHGGVIKRHLQEAGLEIRGRGGPNNLKYPVPVDEVVQLYESGLTCREIGERFGVPTGRIEYVLHQAGVQMRSIADYPESINANLRKAVIAGHTPAAKAKRRATLMGKGNPNWKGGVSNTYRRATKANYKFTPELREAIRQRDDYTCQDCGKVGSGTNRGDALDVHHIDGQIQNNHFSNLITLCRACHMRRHRLNS